LFALHENRLTLALEYQVNSTIGTLSGFSNFVSLPSVCFSDKKFELGPVQCTNEFRPQLNLAICSTGRDALRIMGDKSPKATNKQAAQKQAKANVNIQKKTDAAAAKQAVKPKK